MDPARAAEMLQNQTAIEQANATGGRAAVEAMARGWTIDTLEGVLARLQAIMGKGTASAAEKGAARALVEIIETIYRAKLASP